MSTSRIAGFGLALILFLSTPGRAAEQGGSTNPQQITVAAAGERVRFSSVGATAQIRAQVFSSAGEVIFDSLWKDGSVFDWSTSTATLPSGTYRCLVLARDLEGHVAEKESMMRSRDGEITIETPLTPKVTVLAHDGTDGEIVSTSGDLKFSFGDFLAGTEKQRMRLTANGDLQIDGVLRAKGGVMLPDGSILTTAPPQSRLTRETTEGTLVGPRVGSSAPTASASIRRTQPDLVITPPDYQFKVDAAGLHVGTRATYGIDVAGKVTVGPGTTTYKLNVNDPSNAGLRVETFSTGGQVASFGSLGSFNVDDPAVAGGRFTVQENGNVGIGTPTPAQKLSVAGTIESTSGGIKFPDGSVQTSAGLTTAYTNYSQTEPVLQVGRTGGTEITALSLTLPSGMYLIEVSVTFLNMANDLASDNSRRAFCRLSQADARNTLGFEVTLPGWSQLGQRLGSATLTFHQVTPPISGQVDVLCIADGTEVYLAKRRMTAISLANVIVQ